MSKVLPGGFSSYPATPGLNDEPFACREDEIQVEEVTTESSLSALADEWNPLLGRSENNLLFLTYEWIGAWWKHLGRPRHHRGQVKLFVVTVRHRGQLCGLAPLMIDVVQALGISTRVVRFLGEEVSDYCDLIVTEPRERVIQAIVEHLVSRASLWDAIELRNFYAESPNLLAVRKWFTAHKLLVSTAVENACSFIPVRGEWENFYRCRFDRRRRKDHRREWGHLHENGPPSVHFVTAPEDEPGLLDGLAEIERQHPDVDSGRPGFFALEGNREFFEHVLPTVASLGWLSVVLLKCGDLPVAYYLSFRYKQKYYVYISSYRREFGRFGVGRLLMWHMLQQYWNSGADEIDFLRGDETYKQKWARDVRHTLRLFASRRSLKSRLRWRAVLVVFPAVERRFPRIGRAFSVAAESGWGAVLVRGFRWVRRAAWSRAYSNDDPGGKDRG